jgi:hypothetical protein
MVMNEIGVRVTVMGFTQQELMQIILPLRLHSAAFGQSFPLVKREWVRTARPEIYAYRSSVVSPRTRVITEMC